MIARDLNTRADLVPRVRELRDAGMIYREIAKELGISLSYAHDLYKDPAGEHTRARKHKRTGTCLDCGGPTFNGGARELPRRCQSCARRHATETKRWTRDAILAAIRSWHDRHGEPPSATQWKGAGPDHPAVSGVQREFGGWSVAIEAAGFTPRESRYRPRDDAAFARTLELHQQGLSAPRIARELGDITSHGVLVRLRCMGAYTPTERNLYMSAPLTAQKVLARELERMEGRCQRLREDLAEHERAADALRTALSGLNGKVA